VFEGGKILFLEGYLFDKPDGKTAFAEAARLMKAAGGKSGITLSDPFCADRHRADFQTLIAELLDDHFDLAPVGDNMRPVEIVSPPVQGVTGRGRVDQRLDHSLGIDRPQRLRHLATVLLEV
jgi:hypothetical protein